MSRLRNANPDRLADMRNDQLRDRIISLTPTWRADDRAADQPSLRRAWVPRRVTKISLAGGLRSWIAASGMVAAALAVVLTVSLSGSAPNVAEAFPALGDPSVLTPAALQRSLVVYGVGPNNDGLAIEKGHPVGTPWGTGYVLASPTNSFVCVVAPGLSSTDWGASCAQTKLATSSGTSQMAYAYDPTTHTARLLALLPQSATATMQTAGGSPRQLSLADGLLAVNITARTQIAVTINGHTTTHDVSPQDATTAPGATTGSSSSTANPATSATTTKP